MSIISGVLLRVGKAIHCTLDSSVHMHCLCSIDAGRAVHVYSTSVMVPLRPSTGERQACAIVCTTRLPNVREQAQAGVRQKRFEIS